MDTMPHPGPDQGPDPAAEAAPPAPLTPPPASGRLAGPSVRTRPEGDDRERLTCPDCGWIAYENPKIVVGAVVTDEAGRYLLCRRAIEPRLGYWTLPAGYMELNETPVDGALREAWEEARARIAIDSLLAVYTIPRISQVQLIHRARLTDPQVEPGPESLEVALFPWEEIPWRDLAFPTVLWALHDHRRRRDLTDYAPAVNPIDAVVVDAQE